MKYSIVFEKRALQDIRKIKSSGKKEDLAKLNRMLDELVIHPFFGIGNPEQLKHNLSGFWSRRINKKDRLIYQIIEEPNNLVVIVSALGHYD
jgi:toxin YoeB